MRAAAPTIAVLALFVAAPAASGWVGGTSGCGDCGIPADRFASASRLIEQLPTIPTDELDTRMVLGEICVQDVLDCGTLTEDEARRVIEAQEARNGRWWDMVEKIALQVIAAAGLALGVANHWQQRS